ncbi:hypothetical protein MKW92_013500 [Papaver armeniacum]|nr:hypothetical protein MKW92_013500 [Papaver armeniacum]
MSYCLKEKRLTGEQMAPYQDIRSQGDCGCCYAVASADCIIAMNQINKEEKIDLSWQEIIDLCPWNKGCGVGTTLTSYFTYY